MATWEAVSVMPQVTEIGRFKARARRRRRSVCGGDHGARRRHRSRRGLTRRRRLPPSGLVALRSGYWRALGAGSVRVGSGGRWHDLHAWAGAGARAAGDGVPHTPTRGKPDAMMNTAYIVNALSVGGRPVGDVGGDAGERTTEAQSTQSYEHRGLREGVKRLPRLGGAEEAGGERRAVVQLHQPRCAPGVPLRCPRSGGPQRPRLR